MASKNSNGIKMSDKKHKNKSNATSKCASIFSICLFVGVAIIPAEVTEGSVLTVKNGNYKRLTVRISDAVPRQLCHRAINNLQVRRRILFFDLIG